MDVFRQRLEDEYDANVIITAPTVPYKGKIAYLRVLFVLWRLVLISAQSHLSGERRRQGGHRQQSDGLSRRNRQRNLESEICP